MQVAEFKAFKKYLYFKNMISWKRSEKMLTIPSCSCGKFLVLVFDYVTSRWNSLESRLSKFPNFLCSELSELKYLGAF